MNRKLIRTTLAEVKGKVRERRRPESERTAINSAAAPRVVVIVSTVSTALRNRPRPPFRYASEFRLRWKPAPKSFTTRSRSTRTRRWSSVLLDGEEIEGTIEWYDRGALKVNRQDAPNLLVLEAQHQIYVQG